LLWDRSVLFSSHGQEQTTMHGWDDELRTTTTEFLTNSTKQAHALFAEARAMIEKPETADLGRLLGAHITGVTSYADVIFYRLRELANELGRVCGSIAPDASFFDHGWNVDINAIRRFCPELAADVFDSRSNDTVQATELLEPCPNDVVDLGWPTALAGYMRRPRRLPLRAYETDDAVAYVHPYQYQLMTRQLDAIWETASPRSLSRQSLQQAKTIDTDRKIVIIQDRFDFRNFCHLLFDGITRVLHYVEHFGYSGELFVFGGVPGRYQDLMMLALSEHTRVPAESLYFPSTGQLVRTSKSCVWFSDQKELHTHPAQMAHPRSLSALSILADRVPAATSGAKRIYVSRGDADRRRIANEAALISALEGRGFIAVQLAKLSIEEQIGLFRSAEVVVAPHGMGLTHITMGKHIGKVIELFHPQAGTNAYAFVARAAGMEYHYVLGEGIPATHADFSIDVGRVLDVLGPGPLGIRRPHWRKNANLVPASTTFFGFSVTSNKPPPEWADSGFDALIWGQATHVHRKSDPPGNTLVGAWFDIEIAPATLYAASCWVWIPEQLRASSVSIRISGWKSERHHHADLRQANQWQRISFTVVSPRTEHRCSIGLHVVGLAGAMVASTCWQLERAMIPSAYVATG
jgi:hypothetical protein